MRKRTRGIMSAREGVRSHTGVTWKSRGTQSSPVVAHGEEVLARPGQGNRLGTSDYPVTPHAPQAFVC